MSPATIFVLFGLTALVALVSLFVSLYLAARVQAVLPRIHGAAELGTHIQQLRVQMAELMDRVEHWTRRDRVRRVREGQARAAEDDGDNDDELVDRGDLKRLLRERAYGEQ